MTYKRFLKEAEASGVAVCQCCGARLRRQRGTWPRIGGLVAGVLSALGLSLFLSARDLVPLWGTGAMMLAICAVALLVTHHLGWRLVGWIALDDPGRLGASRKG